MNQIQFFEKIDAPRPFETTGRSMIVLLPMVNFLKRLAEPAIGNDECCVQPAKPPLVQ